jgi:hypothetical protein
MCDLIKFLKLIKRLGKPYNVDSYQDQRGDAMKLQELNKFEKPLEDGVLIAEFGAAVLLVLVLTIVLLA